MKIFFILLVSVILITGMLFSQDTRPLIEVTSAVDTSRITIGDRITYTITIDHADTMRIEKPGEGVNLGQFEIKDYKIYDEVQEQGRILQKYEYVVSVFDTGSFVIPPFPVAYFPSDSMGDYKIITASAIKIYVESVIQDEERQLRDIKPPINIPYNYILLISVIGSVLFIGLIIYLGYRLYRKRKETGYLLKPAEPAKPAHEVALNALSELMEKDLVGKGLLKQFYSEISEIVRRYIEGRYFVRALEETSTEILLELKGQELSENAYQNVRELLQLSDLVKFAKYHPTDEENENVFLQAKEFIEETKVIFKSVATPEAEASGAVESVESSGEIITK
jgi:hypothetical protein